MKVPGAFLNGNTAPCPRNREAAGRTGSCVRFGILFKEDRSAGQKQFAYHLCIKDNGRNVVDFDLIQ